MRKVKYIYFRIFVLSISALLFSCRDDITYPEVDNYPPDTDLPVEFILDWPTGLTTRGFPEGTEVKTLFKENDMIHIVGEFNTSYLNDEGSAPETGKMNRYGALRFDGQQWKAVSGSNLTWPATSTDGTFTAYYISESDGVLTNEDPTETVLLSDITPMSDPLMAASDASIEYGHAVSLKFRHLCTNLTLTDIEPLVADNFWFIRPGNLKDENGNPAVFNNAFQISLGSNDYGPTLNFEFVQQPDTQFDNLVYISADRLTIGDDNANPSVNLNYFLQPGYYDTFTICYPAKAPDVYNYLQYDYNSIPKIEGDVSVKKPLLEANTTYTLDITKTQGIIIETPPTAGGWDESEEYYEVDVEEFLKSVSSNTYYSVIDQDKDQEVLILEKTPTGPKLLHNIDFNFNDYTEFKDPTFKPDIQEGSVFDGGLHYIRNVGHPVIHYNFGTIKDLGIKNAEINIVSYEAFGTNSDNSRNGTLCQWNQNQSLIDNVRLSSITFNAQVLSLDPEFQETHNIGGVTGSNTGKINSVELSGNISLNVTGYSSDDGGNLGVTGTYPVMSAVLIGGVTGQNAAEGSIYEVSPLDNTLVINITNSCTGDNGAYSVGGIAGESSGYITGVTLTGVNIDSTGSSGVVSYIGGMAGQLSVSTNNEASMSSCLVGGTVKAGITKKYGVLNSGSYIGGMVGANLGVPMDGCRSTVSVIGATVTNENVIYATGGAIGRIRESYSYNFEDLTAYGNQLVAPVMSSVNIKSFTGNFAGVVPEGQSWDNDYANSNIRLRNFGFNNIGDAFSGNDPTN